MAKKSPKAAQEAGLWGRLRERFGSVARRLGLAEDEDILDALDHQEDRKVSRRPHKKIGQIMVERGRMAESHVEKVLKEQKKGGAKKKAGAKKVKKAKKAGKKAAKKKAKKTAKKKTKKAKKKAKKTRS